MHYQKIDFGGTVYEGVDRSEDYEQIFTTSVQGLTMLDIGCNMGYYSIKTALNGAKCVTGIDTHKPFLDMGRTIKEELKLDNLNFIQADFVGYSGEFDIILCLNTMHHLKTEDEIEYWVENINAMSRKLAVFEVLRCDEGVQFIKNSIGNSKAHISHEYLIDKMDYSFITIVPSKVTEGRDIIKFWKN